MNDFLVIWDDVVYPILGPIFVLVLLVQFFLGVPRSIQVILLTCCVVYVVVGAMGGNGFLLFMGLLGVLVETLLLVWDDWRGVFRLSE